MDTPLVVEQSTALRSSSKYGIRPAEDLLRETEEAATQEAFDCAGIIVSRFTLSQEGECAVLADPDYAYLGMDDDNRLHKLEQFIADGYLPLGFLGMKFDPETDAPIWYGRLFGEHVVLGATYKWFDACVNDIRERTMEDVRRRLANEQR